jgi:dTDP-4-amino-4,6-dideoxygalactose transaminase
MMITLPVIRPTLPPMDQVVEIMRSSWLSGTITVGPTVKSLEEEACRQTGARYAVAISSCTAGLMLVPKALQLAPGSEVIVPSFTFAATAQALLWNGLVPVFCDCVPGTCTLDPEDVERNLSSRTAAICGVSVYGLPPDIDALIEVGQRAGIPVYFDSAQGLGATYRGQPLGSWGRCEVFSLSPTKVVTGIEGGLVTTNDPVLCDRLRAMRDYGKDATGEEMEYLGLSARMSEVHAAVALLSLRGIHDLVKARLTRIEAYRARLGSLPGCWVQTFPQDRTSSGNYFVLFVTDQAKRSRDQVYATLKERGIQSKRYFYPPVHQQTLFRQYPQLSSRDLKVTTKTAGEGLALPLYSHMSPDEFETVCECVEGLLK